MTFKVDQVIEYLNANSKSIGCTGSDSLPELLCTLGFSVRKAGSAGHRVITHGELSRFRASNFNCGHGKGRRPMKERYVRIIIRLLNEYRDDLVELEKEDKI